MELTRIDPWRAALLLLPIGAVAGAFSAYELSPGMRGWQALYFVPIVLFVFTLAGWAAGFLQAAVFNLYVRLMRRGPIIELSEVAVQSDRSAWLTDRATHNRSEARQFIRASGRGEEESPDQTTEPGVTGDSECEGER